MHYQRGRQTCSAPGCLCTRKAVTFHVSSSYSSSNFVGEFVSLFQLINIQCFILMLTFHSTCTLCTFPIVQVGFECSKYITSERDTHVLLDISLYVSTYACNLQLYFDSIAYNSFRALLLQPCPVMCFRAILARTVCKLLLTFIAATEIKTSSKSVIVSLGSLRTLCCFSGVTVIHHEEKPPSSINDHITVNVTRR